MEVAPWRRLKESPNQSTSPQSAQLPRRCELATYIILVIIFSLIVAGSHASVKRANHSAAIRLRWQDEVLLLLLQIIINHPHGPTVRSDALGEKTVVVM